MLGLFNRKRIYTKGSLVKEEAPVVYLYPSYHTSPVRVYQPELPRYQVPGGRSWEVVPVNLELVVREFHNLAPLPVLT